MRITTPRKIKRSITIARYCAKVLFATNHSIYREINRGRVQFGRKSHAELNERSEFNLSGIFDELYDSPVYYPIITWFIANRTNSL